MLFDTQQANAFDSRPEQLLQETADADKVIIGQHKVNDVVKETIFPKTSDEIIHNIIYENWKRFLPEYVRRG